MTGVKYIGPVFDGSGYGVAARNGALAIHEAGYPITVSVISHDETRPDLHEDGDVIRSLVDRDIDYDKVIIHGTPDAWRFYTQDDADKYIIGYTVWETSGLHPVWAGGCNQADEVWVPSRWNAEVFKSSGVNVPVFRMPHSLKMPDLTDISPMALPGVGDNDFVFYSIFQWQERKNPLGLVTAYLAAFAGKRDVALVIKTYRDEYGEEGEAGDNIRESIREMKHNTNLHHYAKIVLVMDNLSSDDVLALHKRGDCFCQLQRAEGWGMPHIEAGACGNPVITPGYGGQTDFLSGESAYLVDYTLRPVTGMPWSAFYQATQYWCEPDLAHAVRLMRHVVDNREEATAKGARAKTFIANTMTRKQVGRTMASRLEQIVTPSA